MLETPVRISKTDFGMRYEHESFAFASIRRNQCNLKRLFGSQLRHNDCYTLRIQHAHAVENHGEMTYYAGNKYLIEVQMSAMQMLSFLTNTVDSPGTPVTLRAFNGSEVPQAQEPPKHAFDAARDGFKKALDNVLETNLTAAIETVQRNLNERRPMTISEKRAVLSALENIRGFARNHAEFYMDRYVEATDTIMAQARAEVETFISDTVRRAGLDAIKDKRILLDMP